MHEVLKDVEGKLGAEIDVAKLRRAQLLMYVLLGDPATRLALPGHEIKLKSKQRKDYVQVKGKVIDASFNGQVMIDWLDATGSPIQSQQVELKRGKFKYRIEMDGEQEIGNIRAYAWNPEQAIDAMGGITLETELSRQEAAAREQRANRPSRPSRPRPNRQSKASTD